MVNTSWNCDKERRGGGREAGTATEAIVLPVIRGTERDFDSWIY